jgi:hypothetical protein
MTFQVVCLSIGYPLKAGHTVAAIPERAGLMALPRPGYVSNRCPHRLTQVWPLPPAQARGPGAFRPRHDSRRGARPSTRWRGAWASRTASEASTPESPGDLPAPPRPAARPWQARLHRVPARLPPAVAPAGAGWGPLAGTPGPGRRRLPRAKPERWVRAGLRGHPAGLLRHARAVSARVSRAFARAPR